MHHISCSNPQPLTPSPRLRPPVRPAIIGSVRRAGCRAGMGSKGGRTMIVVRDVMHIREGKLDEAIQLSQSLVQAVGAGQGFRLLMASSGLLSVLVVESEFDSMGAFEQYRA